MRFTHTVLLAATMGCLLPAQDATPRVSDAERGRTAWDAKLCRRCHGDQGEGGYGPDLAGHTLTLEQFTRAIRKPWGVMPTFSEAELSKQNVSDIAAYLAKLPKVSEPGAWRVKMPPPDAPRGQILLVSNGCGQCHGPELAPPRRILGGELSDANFQLFAKITYEHGTVYPGGRMGSFSRLRLPEATLQEIYRFATEDLGFLVPIAAQIGPGVSNGSNTVYTLAVRNRGVKGKGIAAEGVTIALALAPGATVVSATGDGYQGVQSDEQLKANAAIWHVARIAPQEEQTYTVTVSGKGGNPAELFKSSVVRWTKPEMRHGVPDLAYRDPDMPGKDPQIVVAFGTP
jgi:mono/diheme cytochrome c family protein